MSGTSSRSRGSWSSTLTLASGQRYCPVVGTMLVVRVMQMSIDDIVDMVGVRNCLMSTLSAVGMARVVSGARMGRRAASRIRLAPGENVLVDGSLVEMMQVPVVKIVLVAFVFDGLLPPGGPRPMIVPVVGPGSRLPPPPPPSF